MSFTLSDQVVAALRSLSDVLSEINELPLASSFRRLASRFETAKTADERRSVVIEGLAYFRGMNSLNDLVITNGGKPDVEANRRLEECRRQAYELLILEL